MSVHDRIHDQADAFGIQVLVEPMDSKDVAKFLGVSYGYFRRRRNEVEGYAPEPAAFIGQSPVWEAEVVRRHYAEHGELA